MEQRTRGSVWDFVKKGDPEQCWPFTGHRNREGYGNYRGTGAHRFALADTIGRSLRSDEVALHSCDNPCCCNPAHLSLGTHADNVADRVAKGRSARGERNGRSKLTPEQVLAIFRGGESVTSAALRYGVDRKVVRDIRQGVTWSWLTTPDKAA